MLSEFQKLLVNLLLRNKIVPGKYFNRFLTSIRKKFFLKDTNRTRVFCLEKNNREYLKILWNIISVTFSLFPACDSHTEVRAAAKVNNIDLENFEPVHKKFTLISNWL